MHPSNAKAVTSRFRIYTCVTCIPRIKVWTSLYPLVSAKQKSTMAYQCVHVLKNALFGWEYSMEETICALQCIVCADECVHRTLWVPADCLCHIKALEHFGLRSGWVPCWISTCDKEPQRRNGPPLVLFPWIHGTLWRHPGRWDTTYLLQRKDFPKVLY